jgi:RNA polymerase sigma-70 factor, ECF subfamily
MLATGALLGGIEKAARIMSVGESTGDDRLLERAAAGDVESFAAVYDRYSRFVYSLAWKMLGDPQAAQEITQEVFEAIWRTAGAFMPGRGNARTWILAMAHHKSVDAVRRQRLRAVEPLSESHVDDVDVVGQALERVQGAEVRAALASLAEAQRTVVVLAYYGGYTQQQIARRLGIPLGTVKTRMRDGLRRLRGHLKVAAEVTE